MKLLMILGGLIGFLIGITFGLVQESSWPSIFWRASIAAYASGVLMRWWGRAWVQGLQAAHRERQFAQAKASTQNNSGTTSL
ncbi:MAG: hypothetical protein HY043_13265 [Verrucomicrobia bacterium]|nr:hypothetical protein [Verrucomicrobiota bacterium]